MHFISFCTQVFWVGFVLFTILLQNDPCVNSPLSWKVHALEILFVTSGYLQCYFTPKLWLIFYVYIEIFNWEKKEPDYIKVTAAWDIQLMLLVVNTEQIGSFFILHLKNKLIQFNKHCLLSRLSPAMQHIHVYEMWTYEMTLWDTALVEKANV